MRYLKNIDFIFSSPLVFFNVEDFAKILFFGILRYFDGILKVFEIF